MDAWVATVRVSSVVLGAVGLVGVGLAGGESISEMLLPVPGGLGAVIVGGVLAVKVPTSRVGPVLMLFGVMQLVVEVVHQVVARYGPTGPGPIAAIGEASLFVLLMMSLDLLLLVFPTGRPLWRRVAVVVVVVGVGGFVGGLVWALSMPASDLVAALGSDDTASNPAEVAAPVLMMLGVPVAIASLVARHRRGNSTERAQIRWLLFASGLAFLVVVIPNLTGDYDSWLALGGFALASTGFPLAIGLAVTRYRLYDIDRLISRTVVFAVVAVALGSVYALLAVLPFTLVAGLDGGDTPSWVVAASTLAAAALFSPLRRRVQRVVDRRFNRSRYDAERVVERFASQVRQFTDVATITSELTGVVRGALQPAGVSVWVRGS